jgi:UDP-N-acetyl-D-mannosaminuronate dehydrogenase
VVGRQVRAGRGRRLPPWYSPERIDPGNRTWTLVTTPKIVSGIDHDSLAAAENFYQEIFPR